MAINILQELIDKQDGFEIVRDQIALLIATEVANQVALATTAGKPDPQLWNLRTYIERANPYEAFLNDQSSPIPIINVWYDSSNFDDSVGGTVEHQQAAGVFNIDCYAIGVAGDDGSGGHLPGDKEAALNVQRALRLVRNIIMSSTNTYLQLQKGSVAHVSRRWPGAVQVFQPELSDTPAQQIIAARLPLNVTFSEFSPQYVPNDLEIVNVEVTKDPDGLVILEAQYQFVPVEGFPFTFPFILS